MAQGDKSFVAWLVVMALACPVWACVTLTLTVKAMRHPQRFFSRYKAAKISFTGLSLFEHKELAFNGIRLHTVQTGKPGPGTQLMLLFHGFPEFWYSWRHQLQAFADQYHVVAFDLRGYGQSSCPKGKEHYQMDQLLQDMKCLIAELGYTECILVAHDWGGNIAWHLAATDPHLISRMVILATPHPKAYEDKACMTPAQRKRSWYMLLFQHTSLSKAYFMHSCSAQLDRMLGPAGSMGPRRQGAITPEGLELYKQAFALPGRAAAQFQYYQASIDLVTRSPIAAIASAIGQPIQSVPTLVLRGDSDAFFCESMYSNLQHWAPGSQLLTIKDCSHWIQQDRPEEVYAAISAFLTGKPQSHLFHLAASAS